MAKTIFSKIFLPFSPPKTEKSSQNNDQPQQSSTKAQDFCHSEGSPSTVNPTEGSSANEQQNQAPSCEESMDRKSPEIQDLKQKGCGMGVICGKSLVDGFQRRGKIKAGSKREKEIAAANDRIRIENENLTCSQLQKQVEEQEEMLLKLGNHMKEKETRVQILRKEKRDLKREQEEARKKIKRILELKGSETEEDKADLCAEVEKLKSERDFALSKLTVLENDVASRDTLSGSYDILLAHPEDLHVAMAKIDTFLKSFSLELREKLILNFKGDLWQLLERLAKGAEFVRPAHANYALHAAISAVMFANFENECFLPAGPTLYVDAKERSSESFRIFTELKTEEGWNDAKTKVQFFEFLESKRSGLIQVLTSANGLGLQASPEEVVGEFGVQRENLKLVSLCKAVWSLHKLAMSFNPPASIFRVSRGVEFDPAQMSWVPVIDSCENETLKRVAFCVNPGFRVRKSVIPASVYPEIAKI